MQEDIRKKVFLDVFVSKSTLLPIVVGGTVSMISLATDQWLLALAGFSTGILGVGVFFTKLVFNLEDITKNAFEYLKEEKKLEFEESLDKLELELNEDDCEQLKMIRLSYNHYKEQAQKGAIMSNDELEEKLNKLFEECVAQLKYANELFNTAATLNKDAKKSIIKKRQKVLTEIKDCVDCFYKIIDEICVLSTDKSTKNLSELRDELKSSFEIAKRTSSRMAELENRS